jgi:hypothetical protein
LTPGVVSKSSWTISATPPNTRSQLSITSKIRRTASASSTLRSRV